MAVGKYIVYKLHHPSSEYVYIGLSTLGLERPRQHRYGGSNSRLNDWVQSLAVRGTPYKITVIEECRNIKCLAAAERHHIAAAKARHIPLLNHTHGGEVGASGTPLVAHLRHRLVKLCDAHGIGVIADHIGLGYRVISKAAAGARLRRGTTFLIERGIASWAKGNG